MTTSITAIISGAERPDVTRIDIWRESLAGVGRCEINLDNKDKAYSGLFTPEDAIELKINDISMMKGYVDDVQTNVKDPAAVYRNLMRVMGRDYGQDLVNLFLTKKYLEVGSGPSKVDDIIADALSVSGAEITYTSPHTLPAKTYEFKKTYLLHGLQDLVKLVDADFYVDDSKALQLFLLLNAPSSGVTLKSVSGAADNNILSLEAIGERVGFDIRNYIHVEAGDVDDHWTEGNASDWVPGSGCTISDDTTTFLAGKASLRVTRSTIGAYALHLPTANVFHNPLDLSSISEQDASVLIRTNLPAQQDRCCVITLTDADGHYISWADVSWGADADKWKEMKFSVGANCNIMPFTYTPSDKGWYFGSGCSAFDWSRITDIHITNSAWWQAPLNPAGYNYWIDALRLPVPARSIRGDSSSQGLYKKRMIPVTRTDVKSQLQLNAIAADELAKRKDPTQKITVTATFQSDCKYAGQTVVVNAPSSGITNITYRILSLHHVAAPREDLCRGFDAITEFELVKHETASVQPTDPLRFRLSANPMFVLHQRLEERVRHLEQGIIRPSTGPGFGSYNPPWTSIPASGIVIGGDTNLYRYAANVLKTDDSLIIGSNLLEMLATNPEFKLACVGAKIYGIASWSDNKLYFYEAASGDLITIDTTGNLTFIKAAGKLQWSDVNLYRSAADVLKTDDNFDALSLRMGGTEVITSGRGLKGITSDDRFQVGAGTTDASGDATVTFPVVFSSAPKVFLQGVDASARGIVLDVVSVSTTQVVVKARKTTGLTSGAGSAHTHSQGATGGGSAHVHSQGITGTPSATVDAMNVKDQTVYAAPSSGGSPTIPIYARGTAAGTPTVSPASSTHIHSNPVTDAESSHTHGNPDTNTESAHTHGVDAATLAVDFNWLAVKL
jgi:hypothetical protein